MFPPELFDLEAEPDAFINLGTDPTYSNVYAGLHECLVGICDPDEVDQQALAEQADIIGS
ncbi:MAG: hypothetical protein OXI81_08425 [Paracoccaceae bacterium]|nr:hypothetical protein [Paracoccaceae bacterium]